MSADVQFRPEQRSLAPLFRRDISASRGTLRFTATRSRKSVALQDAATDIRRLYFARQEKINRGDKEREREKDTEDKGAHRRRWNQR